MLIPAACEYADKRDFASVVWGLEMGQLSWNISEWDSVVIRVFIRGRQDGQNWKERGDVGIRGWSAAL